MSSIYFCVFCDTVVRSADELSIHLAQHLTESQTLTEAENDFLTSLIEYEIRLSQSLAMNPKQLPEDRAQTLLIGCPVCDPIIRNYDLIQNLDTKNVSEECSSKTFKISYLGCLSFEGQRDHCYRHLSYYPLICQIRGDSLAFDQICGQQLFLMKDCETHLEVDHKFCLNSFEDRTEVCAKHYEFSPIDKIDELINDRLNSKPILNASVLFDEEIETFHYTTEGLERSEENLITLQSIGEQLAIPSASKPRGRTPKAKRKSQDQNDSNCPKRLEVIEPIDLMHSQNYMNWFNQTKTTKFPYFPQKDDEVYYLPYGHELYKDEVMKRNLYGQSNRNFTIKYFKNYKIECKVSKIDFLFKECRRTKTVIRLLYATLRPKQTDIYGNIVHVKYHHIQGIADFIVLKEHLDSSITKEWQIGEQFRSLMDDRYRFGTVVGYNEAEYCQMSAFKKYRIQWLSNNSLDLLSPWDMEELSGGLTSYSDVPVNNCDRKKFFVRHTEEWPNFNESKELGRLSKGLRLIYHMDKAKEFPIIQDVTQSRYLSRILYPIDLKTVIARVENRFYRRHLAIKYDVKFLEANIRKLIKSVRRDPEYRLEDTIAKRLKYHTKFVTALCLVFIDTHECHNPYDLYPHIDDYLETHDVKCYSAKRVHLNTRKKYPNILPVPHKRIPKRPQSFGDALKTLQVFQVLKNIESVPKAVKLSTETSTSQNNEHESQDLKPVAGTSTASNSQFSVEMIVPHINSQSSDEKKLEIDFDGDSEDEDYVYNHSSDVCRSETLFRCSSHGSDAEDSDDPDYETSNYYKNKF